MPFHATLVTPPASEPVSLEEMKAFAKIDGDDEDALLDSFIRAARQSAEEFTGRAFVTQSWKLSLDLPRCRWADELPSGVYDLPVSVLHGDMRREIGLGRPPLRSVASVTTYSTSGASTVFAPSNYLADLAGNRLVLAADAAWPTGLRESSAVEIVTSNGYGDPSDVPSPIKIAILMHANQMYEERGLCGTAVPAACQQLLRQFRVERL